MDEHGRENPYQEPARSADYASYPQFDREDGELGTPVMSAPAKPSAHPDNAHAADGSLSSRFKASSTAGDGDGDGVYANKAHPTASVGGAVPQSPYVQAGPATGASKGGSREQLRAQVAECTKRAQTMVNNVWCHLSTGGSVADNAWGRVTAATQVLSKGGFDGVYRGTFAVDADERLLKTYACFLSTSTGPVGGTLFLSSRKLAFCSDRPLSYTPANADQPAFSYYKVIVPLTKVKSLNPSANASKPAEKYIQVVTDDAFEFWFMGFVNYDKGVKNLQQAVLHAHDPKAAEIPRTSSTLGETHFETGPVLHPQYSHGLGQSQQQVYPPAVTTQHDDHAYYPPNQYGTVPPDHN